MGVGPHFQGPAPGWYAGLGVRMRPRDIEDELAVADDVGKVAVFRELKVDVSLFPLVLTFCINSTRGGGSTGLHAVLERLGKEIF